MSKPTPPRHLSTLPRRARSYAEPSPVVSWAVIEDCPLTTSDNEQIGGWLIRGRRSHGCVLLLHGLGSSRRAMLPVMQGLAEAHYTTLAITFRAHGDSSGRTIDFGWSARHDVIAAIRYLREEFPGQPIYVVGRSMGAAAAIFAAKEIRQDVAGYFLEQPYKDLDSAVWNRLHCRLPPILDWTAYAGLQLWSKAFLSVDAAKISPIEHITDIPADIPIVLASGSTDRHAPLGEVVEICHCVASHARLVVFEGAAHVALNKYDANLYQTSLFGLLEANRPH